MSLSVLDITVSLGGKHVLRDITFELPEKGMYFLLGPNGAGKTTLLKAVRGLVKADCGEIKWQKRPIKSYSAKELAGEMCYLPQQTPSLDMSVMSFALLGAAPYLKWGAVPGEKHREQALAALKDLGITELADKSMEEISGGERQLAALAQALVQNSPLMLLDEPTANLDVKRQRDFFNLLREIVKIRKKCALLSVHDPNLALNYGDGVIVLTGSETVFLKGAQDIKERLCGVLRPIYGQELALSADGFCYWKTERRL